ncbi:MAG: aldo/keto reductase [Tepidisphaeraceae bacterium]|jgi:aryl-alcohol dehydrogenase-like predicted oxidoreductase
MKYRRLGKSNLRVSVIGMGTWQFGGEWGKDFVQDEVDRIFDAARETGINLIDTAECYGDHLSEAFIGNAIQRDRENWIVATKFGHKFHSHLNRTDERTAPQMLRQVEDSLQALKTDYIDLLQYHSIRFEEFDNDELTAALQKLMKAGKVRHLGNSISGQTRKNIDQVENSTRRHAEAIQVIYNRLDRTPEERVFSLCQQQNLGVLARVPLASGFLSGKYKLGTSFGANDVRAGQDKAVIERRLREVEEIRRKEVPAGIDMAQWALAWCLQHPAVTAVIPGCKDDRQLRANAAAAESAMVSEDHPQAWK